MEVTGIVRVHSADDDKEKYVVTVMGITKDLIEVKLKLESKQDGLLKNYPRGAEFIVTIKQAKEK